MNVVMMATQKDPPTWRIIHIKATPCPISSPFSVLRDKVVIGINNMAMPAPRTTSIQKKASEPVSLVRILYPQKQNTAKNNMPKDTRNCCLTPFCNSCPITGIMNAVVMEEATINMPDCSAVQPNVLCCLLYTS